MDVIATVVLSLMCLGAAAATLFASPFLLMSTDSAGDKPNLKPLGWSYAVTWGSVAVGVIGSIMGIYLAARHDRPMWWWPALGVVVIGAGFALGGLLAVRTARPPGGTSN